MKLNILTWNLNFFYDNWYDRIKSINKVGDCVAPGMIANSIYSGYKVGIELGKNKIHNNNPNVL